MAEFPGKPGPAAGSDSGTSWLEAWTQLWQAAGRLSQAVLPLWGPPHPAIVRWEGQVWGRVLGHGRDWIFIFRLQWALPEGLAVACRGQGKDRRVDFLGRRKDVGGWPWILGFCAL